MCVDSFNKWLLKVFRGQFLQHAIEVTEAGDVYSGFNEGNLSAHSASFNDAVPDTAKEWQEFPLI